MASPSEGTRLGLNGVLLLQSAHPSDLLHTGFYPIIYGCSIRRDLLIYCHYWCCNFRVTSCNSIYIVMNVCYFREFPIP